MLSQSVRKFFRLSLTFSASMRIFLVVLLIFLISPITPARADTNWCGPITVDTTWAVADNNHIVTCLVQVLVDVTLTIEPGARVLFNPGTSLRIDGTLIAQEVTFTSNSSTPVKGDWGRIFFMATSKDAVFDANGDYISGSLLQDSTVVYSGGGSDGAVMTYGSSPFLSGNMVLNSASRGIYAQGRSPSKPVVLRDNFVTTNNVGGIYVSTGQVISTTIQNNIGRGVVAISSDLIDNIVTDNTGGGIYAENSNITGNSVSGNSAISQGGGIYAIGGTLDGNDVSGNSLSPDFTEFVCGGGIYASAATLSDNIVNGNQVNGGFFGNTLGGAGVCAYLSNLTNNKVTNNTAAIATSFTYGGGIYSEGSIISHNLVSGNSVTGDTAGYGGGIYAKGGTTSINTVKDNVASGILDSQGGGVYGDTSTLQANSLTGNNANKGGAAYARKCAVTNNTILTNTTSLTGTLYMDQGTATGNTIQGNTAVYGGGIFGIDAILTGNTLQNNTANFGAGIYAKQSTVRGNTLTGNIATSDGGGLYAVGGTITSNMLTGNMAPSYGHGSGAYLSGVTDFTYNSILTNTASGGTAGGVSVSGQSLVQYNNFYGNQPYDVEIVSSEAVSGTLNYWGVSACTSIPGQIYDGNDVPGRGRLSYAPSLYLPVPVAQLAVPSDLVLDNGETSVSLSWAPIPPIPNIGCRVPGSTAPDQGYRVYYDTDNACGPYNGHGLPQGDSPIDVGNTTDVTLTGLSPYGYYFVVASYDYLGREGAYSNVVMVPPSIQMVYLPVVRR